MSKIAINMNLLSRLGTILVRVLILFPGFLAAGYFLDGILGHQGFAWKQPSFFWYLCGIQGIWGILCLIPYPDFLFRKKIKIIFLLLVSFCVAHQLWRTWLPSYYASPELKNYPQYVKDFETAKHHNKNDDFYTSQPMGDKTLWLVQYPDFYEFDGIIIMSLYSFGPIILFFIRNYQVRRNFTWKETIHKITSR